MATPGLFAITASPSLGFKVASMLRTGTGSESARGVRKMRSWLLAVGLLAAAAVSPAQAADLDGDEPPPPSYWPHSGPYGGRPYAEPRYTRPTPPPAYRDDDNDNDDDRYNAVPVPRKSSNGPPRYYT